MRDGRQIALTSMTDLQRNTYKAVLWFWMLIVPFVLIGASQSHMAHHNPAIALFAGVIWAWGLWWLNKTVAEADLEHEQQQQSLREGHEATQRREQKLADERWLAEHRPDDAGDA